MSDQVMFREVKGDVLSMSLRKPRFSFALARSQNALAGARFSLHVVTFLTMLGWAMVTLLSGRTLHSSASYLWFINHWPYADERWGFVFLYFAMGGAFTFFIRGRLIKLSSAIILGGGHAMIFHAIYVINPISTAVVIYALMALVSMTVITITIIEDW